MKNKGGFTLLELILVLAIISVLISIILPVVRGEIKGAERVSARLQAERIYQAVLDFYNDLGFLPIYIDYQERPHQRERYNILRSFYGKAPEAIDSRWLETTKTGYIEDQLITNQPGYREKKTEKEKYGWDGPYLRKYLPPDPWGNKYYINVEFLDKKRKPSERHRVWIISAGPNKIIDTTYQQLQTNGTLQEDDIGLAIIHK
jgi:prepilin-type N-terminal cleavage/methylation domain-containing protein